MQINKIKRIKRTDNCVYRILRRKAIIYLIKEKKVIELNETGSKLWLFLSKKRTENQIISQLIKLYNLDLKQSKNDVIKFVDEGLENGMLKRY